MQRTAVAVLAATAVLPAGAQSSSTDTLNPREAASFLGEPAKAPLNQVALSYRMGFNIKADFKKLGGFQRLSNPGPATGSAVDRTYDNGYNRVDLSGNEGSQTWYWGYETPDAVQGDSLVLNSSASPANNEVKGAEDGIQHGVELMYSRAIRDLSFGRLGFELGLSYLPINISDNSRLLGQADTIVDTFALGGVVPPLAPYSGTLQGPGPLLGSSPDRSREVIPASVTVLGQRELDSDLLVLRVGPRLDFPIRGRLSGNVSGGLSLAYADTRFSYSETVIIPGIGTQGRSGDGAETDFMVGAYVGGAISLEVMERTAIFAGAYFQSTSETVTKSEGRDFRSKESVIDLGQSIVVSLGVSYSF